MVISEPLWADETPGVPISGAFRLRLIMNCALRSARREGSAARSSSEFAFVVDTILKRRRLSRDLLIVLPSDTPHLVQPPLGVYVIERAFEHLPLRGNLLVQSHPGEKALLTAPAWAHSATSNGLNHSDLPVLQPTA